MTDKPKGCSEEQFNVLRAMILHVSTEQCKEEGLPNNLLVSVFLNLAQDVFIMSVEDIVNKCQDPQAARTFIGVQMKIIQLWVGMAAKVDGELGEMIAAGKR